MSRGDKAADRSRPVEVDSAMRNPRKGVVPVADTVIVCSDPAVSAKGVAGSRTVPSTETSIPLPDRVRSPAVEVRWGPETDGAPDTHPPAPDGYPATGNTTNGLVRSRSNSARIGTAAAG